MKIDLKSLSVTELDSLVLAAGQERARREPAFPNEPPKEVQAFVDPQWYASLQGADTLLQIKHIGFGWLSFLLPSHERANLLSLFLRHSLISPNTPPTATPEPNQSSGGGKLH